MKSVTHDNFGLLIAYLIPGFTALWGVSYFSETVRSWLQTTPANVPTVGGFLYVTIASAAAGLIASTVRWAVVDTIHHSTGVRRPNWDYGTFHEKVAGFEYLVSTHYRYYQAYGNSLVAVAFTFVTYSIANGWHSFSLTAAIIALECILRLGSRDTLMKYYRHVGLLLGEPNDSNQPDDNPSESG